MKDEKSRENENKKWKRQSSISFKQIFISIQIHIRHNKDDTFDNKLQKYRMLEMWGVVAAEASSKPVTCLPFFLQMQTVYNLEAISLLNAL